ncbi:ATP phosphoribosyltransferase [Spirochaeta cellobiosiphila]|uniref:ATP phosphoribosyltransferase n=1 Tax=Spirochaeta cellobiosiphila TaxID=504483 RepID=UPI000413E9B0|nr:ATP phosphoribosyltransferase [Spirochaeta cellobiosiphila]
MKETNIEPLTLALPKGRLFDQTQEYFAKAGIHFSFEKRKLVAWDQERTLKIMLVKNGDLPTYVHHGIAGLGVCGDDVIYESGLQFNKLRTLPFGSTKICLAGKKDSPMDETKGSLTLATKFTKFTTDYFHKLGIPVKIIKLNGSVELAPILGLAPYIVDLVETGGTLKANHLEVIKKLADIEVYFIANPAYYKLRYKQINTLLQTIAKGDE